MTRTITAIRSGLLGAVLMLAGCEGGGGGGSGKEGMDHVNGTMSMSGTVGGEPISVSGDAYSLLDYFDREGDTTEIDDMQVGLIYNGEYLGLEIEEPDRMESGGTYSISSSGFTVDLEGALVGTHYGTASDGDPEVKATGGYISVSTFEGNTFVGTYQVRLPDGSSVSGSINLTNFDTRVR